ncbi:uncharacterized protein LOC134539581 [Bacillus rossius redtenbacheri]|uniref:uncharacterized protein LOC134539581 n=1 Tax=Bacillus rossius redtenbacheri TaxID=93214 RepID=UPI002FDCF187
MTRAGLADVRVAVGVARGGYALLVLALLCSCVVPSSGISCYMCGQYTDGVGSITPCLNLTAANLKECPESANFCIKYVSEGSVVRDCVEQCTEKEAWGTKQYCCAEHGCNSAPRRSQSAALLSLLAACLWRLRAAV